MLPLSLPVGRFPLDTISPEVLGSTQNEEIQDIGLKEQ
jgi:hypothetical protein